LMVYARVASGYRLGGVNVNAVANGTPVKYEPDKTVSYELGLKSDFLDHALSFEAAAYHIDWNKLQITLRGLSGPFVTNVGRAKSDGLEFSLLVRPARGLTIAASGSLSDAQLTENLPPPPHALVIGNAGDRLPFSSRLSGKLSADQDVPLTDTWTGFVGGSITYVGSRYGDFNYFYITTPRLVFPGYANTQLHLGARHDSWAVNMFANNVADRRGITSGNSSFAESPFYLVYIQPRTVGLSVSRSF
jgi:iron complex outermembrane recepter protein